MIIERSNYYAAVDLGSNSFHMTIAKYDGNSFQMISKHKEKVQLAAGLDENNNLDQETINRGLTCLRLFAERLKDIDNSQVKIVATYTLRTASNAHEFIEQAEKILHLPIEILPGKEEARLIYNGISHNHPDINKALAIDIGGGSTELILGNKFEALALDSLDIGCVTLKQFFRNGQITLQNFEQAELYASLIISPVANSYKAGLWDHCLGSSGSIEAISKVIKGLGYTTQTLKIQHLELLKNKLIEIGNIENINLDGLSESRINTFTTGLVILLVLFKELNISKIYLANASLRDGILYELQDELQGNDNRNLTVVSLVERFGIDWQYAKHIEKIASQIFDDVCDEWGIYDPHFKNLLNWSCQLHEVGLSISLSKLRHHSAHIIRYADMPGFSLQTKESLAAIIFSQHKKLALNEFENRYEPKQVLLALSQILRLAILLNIKRDAIDTKSLKFEAFTGNCLNILIPGTWAKEHQLIMFELAREKETLSNYHIKLDWKLI